MRFLLVTLLCLNAALLVRAQTKWIDRTGSASFYSSAPMEDIKAQNNQAVSILDVSSGEIVASMLMRSFDFRKALMEEHFNENFIESHKYPKASFKGKVTNIDKLDLSREGDYTLDIEGEITIHGVTQPIRLEAAAAVGSETIEAKAVFPLRVSDFKIEIPKLVRNNIAEVVEVTVSFNYKRM